MALPLLLLGLIAVVAHLLFYTVYNIIRTAFFSKLLKVPGLPYGPLYGNVRESIQGEAGESSVRWVRKYGGVVRFYQVFGRECLLIADIDAMRHVLVTNSSNYPRPISRELKEIVPEGLVSLEGSKHWATRKLLNPSFNHSAIRGFLPIFHKTARRLTDKVEEMRATNSRVNMQHLVKCATMDAIGLAAFNKELCALDGGHNEQVEALNSLIAGQKASLLSSIPFYRCLPLRSNRQHKKAMKVVDELCSNMVEKAGQSNADDGNILSKLVTARWETTDSNNGSGLSNKAVRDHIVTFMIAGHETSSYTLSWLLLMLGRHPEVQAKLYEELSGVNDTSLLVDDLGALKYLDACVKETLRLYPSASASRRTATNDDIINGYDIPAGTDIYVHFGAMMRTCVEDGDEFQPQRFLQDGYENRKWLPFSVGTHACIGSKFALVEMKLLVVYLVRTFTFTATPDLVIHKKRAIVVKPYPDIELIVNRRH